MIEFNITNHRLRNSNLFHVPVYKNNCSSTSFFPRALKLANFITDYVNFLIMSRIVFNRNVYFVIDFHYYCFNFSSYCKILKM
jgi:hypothetical protein